jgi:hypothetical protein
MSFFDASPSLNYGTNVASVSAKHQMINNLELLQHLLKRGFLTEAEYEARRRQLVDQLTNTTFSSNSYCVPNQSELLPAYLAEPRALSPENDITLNNFSDILGTRIIVFVHLD